MAASAARREQQHFHGDRQSEYRERIFGAIAAGVVQAIKAVRATILKHLPMGYGECIQYGMISYAVPELVRRIYGECGVGDIGGLRVQRGHKGENSTGRPFPGRALKVPSG